MRFLHVMVRIKDIQKSLEFYCDILGLKELYREDYSLQRFTLIYLVAPEDYDVAEKTHAPLIELTYNWDPENYTEGRNFGHIALEVDNIYTVCTMLLEKNIILNRPPRDGKMAFIRSPDNISIELLQKGEALPKIDPWKIMTNKGEW